MINKKRRDMNVPIPTRLHQGCGAISIWLVDIVVTRYELLNDTPRPLAAAMKSGTGCFFLAGIHF